ncbi:HypC/HybG/HupF family hydrogenase formation chaperone [Rhodocyclus tenuis]|uniref:HypC/HybG/HupF family hydrogenase formation chaperone n=1 Tax=Rhodocyclus tenuis TaxID=1066 RepID=UPI001904BAF2|nr:HypC/HybG/HupF family hydrogenase formation chaperone [Rhodocyclus tenuis]MBK1679823.1 RNA methyltransferase [Rhodocyclus tenuis]
MCIGIPMQVVAESGQWAWCEGRGERQRLDMRLIGMQPPGTWVLAFLGTAREVLDAKQAMHIGAALDALDASLRGEVPDIDLLFADLVGREPQLPAHLRPASGSE